MDTKKLREIPKKNYITAGLYVVLSIILIFYIARWYDVYQEDNLNNSIINKYLINEMSYQELPAYLSDHGSEVFYLGIVYDLESRSYEKVFKNIVDSYKLSDKMIYLNITAFSEENTNYIDLINKEYGTPKIQIKSVPAIVVFEDGKFSSVLDDDLTKTKTIKYLKKYDVID